MVGKIHQVTGQISADIVRKHLSKLANKNDAAFLQRYFKTGPGEYGEGDIFLGIRVPALQKAAKAFALLPMREIDLLLKSPIHEHRLLALMILVQQYDAGDARAREKIYRHYLKRSRYVNNWDLVDSSAAGIVGRHLLEGDLDPIYRLADSPRWWERRIAVVATYHFIRQRKFDATFELARRLLDDEHDLMHKAVGWMLREIGKRDLSALREFLDANGDRLPRTALRYAIEKMESEQRRKYLGVKRKRLE